METASAGGTTLTPKGQATRDRIVRVASELTRRHGVARTSTEDVRSGAGVSASQLYHYFADKKALVRAVIAYQTDAVLAAQEPHVSRLDSLEALQAWRDHAVDVRRRQRCQGGCPLGTLSSELAEVWPEAREDLAASFGRWETAIRQGIQAMADRGEFRAGGDPDRLAFALLAAMQGGLLLSQTLRDTAPLEAALDTMLEYIATLMA